MTLSEHQRQEAVARIEEEINRIKRQIEQVVDLQEVRRLKRQLSGKQNLHRRLLGKFR